MRICDRCHAKATDEISIQSTSEHFDLCSSCLYKIIEVINDKESIIDKVSKKLTKPLKKGTKKV